MMGLGTMKHMSHSLVHPTTTNGCVPAQELHPRIQCPSGSVLFAVTSVAKCNGIRWTENYLAQIPAPAFYQMSPEGIYWWKLPGY